MRGAPARKDSENRRTTSRHHSDERAGSTEPPQERCQRGAVHQTGLLEIVPRPGCRERKGAAGRAGGSTSPTRLVEPGVGIAGPDRERGVLREEQHQVERGYVGRTQPFAAARRPGRPRAEEERNIGPDRERDPPQRLAIAHAERPRQAADHGRRVRRAAAQPRGHRRALVDADGDGVAGAEPVAEGQRRAGGEVRLPAQLGPAGDMAGDGPRPWRDADVHPIAEVERRHEREDVVVAVGAGRPDAQDQVHLGRGGRGEAHAMPLSRNRGAPDPGFGSQRGLG